ncbi:hypothetical protein IKK_02111 [Bacillus mycoides]|uniref:Uncharacterized protein n=4 Tax=Bacillus cereus group TaxID=86661 RepID=A0AAP8KRS2_BACMY|nr:hypothetical protein IKK_02111 [Bacillus mycoides]PJN63063.1 hypothetical protein BACWE_52570 [Bacillus mycoides]PJN66127.1 hypothetical protein BAWEI_20460 [Bacillus mycoides]
MPLSLNINLTINGEPRFLKFSADKVDIYKNTIKTNLNYILIEVRGKYSLSKKQETIIINGFPNILLFSIFI